VSVDDVEDGLAAREAELAERERQAAASPADPDMLAALAKERDALADAREAAAGARDTAALTRRERAAGRDVAASERDRRSRGAHDDGDPGFPDRFLSGRDVDASAGDRADALHDERSAREDRQRSREDRHRASDDRDAASEAVQKAADVAAEETAAQREELEDRILIGIAQGLLMADHNVSAEEALDLLAKRSQSSNVKLRDIAARLVEERANG
jgi:hypothetical protein